MQWTETERMEQKIVTYKLNGIQSHDIPCITRHIAISKFIKSK